MPSDLTRTSILDAAERLYADRGFADVTLRDIVAAAGVNLAAVNYHFGSKDELIAELFVTRSLATNRERLNELRGAGEGGGRRPAASRIAKSIICGNSPPRCAALCPAAAKSISIGDCISRWRWRTRPSA